MLHVDYRCWFDKKDKGRLLKTKQPRKYIMVWPWTEVFNGELYYWPA